MKRLIILPNNIGDVIMAAPLFEAFKRNNSGDEIHFLVEKGYEGGILNNPYLNKIHLFPRSKSAQALRDASTFGSEARELSEYIDSLADEQFDQIINLSQHPLYSVLTSLISAKEVVGMNCVGEGIDILNNFWTRYLFAIPYNRKCNSMHAIDVYKRIAGVPNDPAEPKIFLSEEEKKLAKAWLSEEGWDGEQKLIVFQPGAAIASKMWGTARFTELGHKLIADGWKVLITGAPSEVEMCKTIAEALGKDTIMSAGKTTFRESVSFMSCAQAVVTGDTALMHAAAALEIKTYALFGPTSPVETGPYGSGHAIFVTDSCKNPPCFKHSCDGENCLNDISVETVFEAINGGAVHYRTAIENGQYSLVEEERERSRYIDEDASKAVLELLTNGEIESTHSAEVNSELVKLEKILSLASMSLSHFQQGDSDAYQRYAEHISKMQELTGVGEFFSALINIGLNSIPLTDMNAGVQEMQNVLVTMVNRIREVINA